MRVPYFRRFDDDIPFTWIEWILMPLYVPIFFLVFGMLALLSIPYFWLYPERHANRIDFEGSPEEQERFRAYREYRSRISLGRRVLERLHLVDFDAGPTGHAG